MCEDLQHVLEAPLYDADDLDRTPPVRARTTRRGHQATVASQAAPPPSAASKLLAAAGDAKDLCGVNTGDDTGRAQNGCSAVSSAEDVKMPQQPLENGVGMPQYKDFEEVTESRDGGLSPTDAPRKRESLLGQGGGVQEDAGDPPVPAPLERIESKIAHSLFGFRLSHL